MSSEALTVNEIEGDRNSVDDDDETAEEKLEKRIAKLEKSTNNSGKWILIQGLLLAMMVPVWVIEAYKFWVLQRGLD
jgi:hypothetical protein